MPYLRSLPRRSSLSSPESKQGIIVNDNRAGAIFSTRWSIRRAARTALKQAANTTYHELERTIWLRVEAAQSPEIAAAAESLGLACPAHQALQTLLMLLDRCGDDFETAVTENVMAGGDNAARGLALGMILGAAHGKSHIPARWLERLEATPRIEALLTRQEGVAPSSR